MALCTKVCCLRTNLDACEDVINGRSWSSINISALCRINIVLHIPRNSN